ncbi:hypothetical protein HaLaN_08162 [Haematococcus lacustris]|uniref:Uncharacterized protein n=1 Tax=Haematococcus lacustris TaxID=44745 RepID=A0A699YTA9_HAELA|nr:hypothetical protein HaLaN_08162 [Haematococcus lacustris]
MAGCITPAGASLLRGYYSCGCITGQASPRSRHWASCEHITKTCASKPLLPCIAGSGVADVTPHHTMRGQLRGRLPAGRGKLPGPGIGGEEGTTVIVGRLG